MAGRRAMTLSGWALALARCCRRGKDVTINQHYVGRGRGAHYKGGNSNSNSSSGCNVKTTAA